MVADGSLWSVILSGLGLAGLHFTSTGSRWGAVTGLIDEAVWVGYGAATHQWPFCLSALAYGWVYSRNLRIAYRSDRPQVRTRSAAAATALVLALTAVCSFPYPH